MALGEDHFLGNEDFVADRAVLTLGQTSLRAGRSLCCIDYFCVAGRRDFFHTGENRITNGALRTGCMTSLGAGCGLLGNFNGSMTGSSDCFGFGFVADCAGVGLDTGIFTGRSGRDLALIPTVSIRGNLSLRNDDCVADGAVLALGLAGCGAGGLNCRVNDLGVSLRGNHCLCHENLIADRAVLARGLAGLGAGGGDCRVNDLGVSLGGNSRAGAYFLAAILAVGVAGIAILGASGGFRVADLGVLM